MPFKTYKNMIHEHFWCYLIPEELKNDLFSKKAILYPSHDGIWCLHENHLFNVDNVLTKVTPPEYNNDCN